ncbi:MAG: hypothetical protein J7K30_07380 [Deltaproteobacteria bacterium]|nr:hypothetical protein [Deltaproteobacteria bacterium]
MKTEKGKITPSVKQQDDKADKNNITLPPAADEDREPQHINQIRDILFGAQARQYEQKFSCLEAFLKRETANLRNETKKIFESLENYVKNKLNSLADQIKAGEEKQTKTEEELSGIFRDTNRNMGKKITMLDEKNIKGQRELQEQILQQSKNLMEEIYAKHEEISAAVEQSVKELGKDKTDRLALSNLLMEMSLRLKEEFNIPEIE